MAETSGSPGGTAGGGPRNPGDQAAPGTDQTGMVPCTACQGRGRQGESACPNCGGTGQVVQIVGDA